MIEAVIFDFDGTILDTETPDYRSWQETFQSFGASLERSLWTRFIGGRPSFDALSHLAELCGREFDRDDVGRRRRRRYLELVEAEPILPGVLELIADAERLKLRLGVASSSTRNWVEGHLRQRGLLARFQTLRSADDVRRVKPDPELYLAAAADLGVAPHRALAIEDSANGVTAAKRAGLYCVAVPNSMTAEMDFSRADAVYPSLAAVSLEKLSHSLDRLKTGALNSDCSPTAH